MYNVKIRAYLPELDCYSILASKSYAPDEAITAEMLDLLHEFANIVPADSFVDLFESTTGRVILQVNPKPWRVVPLDKPEPIKATNTQAEAEQWARMALLANDDFQGFQIWRRGELVAVLYQATAIEPVEL